MLHDRMGDALESLLVKDDGGRWHQGYDSSCEGKSKEDEDEMVRVGSGLEVLTWLPKLLWDVAESSKEGR